MIDAGEKVWVWSWMSVHQMAEGQDNNGDKEASEAIQTCQDIVDSG
jgi:hypothetical protein